MQRRALASTPLARTTWSRRPSHSRSDAAADGAGPSFEGQHLIPRSVRAPCLRLARWPSAALDVSSARDHRRRLRGDRRGGFSVSASSVRCPKAPNVPMTARGRRGVQLHLLYPLAGPAWSEFSSDALYAPTSASTVRSSASRWQASATIFSLHRGHPRMPRAGALTDTRCLMRPV